MRSLRSWLVVPSVVLLCACGDCNSAVTPKKRAQQQLAAKPSEGTDPLHALPMPEGTPIATDQLRRFALDAIADFSAKTPAEAQTMPLASGGALTRVHRSYARGEQRLDLEISDTLHAPALRKVIESQQGLERSTGRTSFRGTPIAGQPGLVQWFSANHLALVNVIVRGRILVNVKLTPADDPDAVIKIAETLPFAQLAELVDSSDADETPEPTTPTPPSAPEQPAKAAPAPG